MSGDPIAFLADLMHRGGPVMWPIVLCSLLAVSVTLRKACQWLRWQLALRLGANGWRPCWPGTGHSGIQAVTPRGR